MSPGKTLRLDETKLHASFYHRVGIPIIGEITAPATAEGGDCFWLDDTTIAVGRGFRTNRDGVVQLSNILGHQGIHVLSFDLPVYQGKDACLHLMSVVSMLAENLALVYATSDACDALSDYARTRFYTSSRHPSASSKIAEV